MSTKNWLSKIKQDTRVNVLAVPGTHDAASIVGASMVPVLTITQQFDIPGQLNAGVRVLDMRVAHSATYKWFGKEDIYMCHGRIVFDLKLSEALASVKEWLSENDTEFVAMIFQQQGTISSDVTEKRRVHGLITAAIKNAFPGNWVYRPGGGQKHWPTIGTLKKKVMLFSRLQEDVAGYFDLRSWNTASLEDMLSKQYDVPGTKLKVAIQDRYTKVTNSDLTKHINRWAAWGILDDVDQIAVAKLLLFERLNSQYNDDPTLKINHLSHSLKCPEYPQPYQMGTDLNKRLKASILENKDKRYRGFVMIDDAEKGICKSIINSNLIYQNDSRG